MDDQPSNSPEQKTNNTSKIIVAIVVIIAALVAGFFLLTGDDTNQSAETTTDQTPQTTPLQPNSDQDNQPTASDEQSQNTITYTDSGFTPATLSVKVGDTVTVVNRSSRPLQFSSDVHPTHTNNPELNQRTAGPGDNVSFTINKPGTHGYHDHLDASRTGTLIVEE